MSTRFYFEGLDEFRRALRDLPEHLAQEAGGIIEEETAGAEVEIGAAYSAHSRSGKLRRALRRRIVKDRVSVTGEVRNTSRLAIILENGSQARHTDIGANRGSMPPAHVFVPVMQRRRRRTYERLKEMMVREGLLVTE